MLDKPFIVVEGFDPTNKRGAVHYYLAAYTFFTKARKAGADVLILDFADGGANLIENAAVVQRAIRYISGYKRGSTPIRVAGISMGGVIARYALATDHSLDVSHYLSLDAPHQGAVADSSLLAWIKKIEGMDGTAEIVALLKTKAARQMLEFNPYAGENERDSLLKAVKDAGYPDAKNIGVAFSSGSDRGISGRVNWLAVTKFVLVGDFDFVKFYMTADESISKPGSYLPLSFTSFTDARRRAQPTFIQHSSALDAGNAEWDVELSASSDRFHNEFPNELTELILHWLGYKSFPLRVSLEGDYFLQENERASWSVASVGGGSGFYEYRWAHWISCPSSDGGAGGASGASLTCDAWHDAGAAGASFAVDSLSLEGSQHGISVSATDRYARHLAPAGDTIWVTVYKRRTLDPITDAQEQDSAPLLEDNYPNPFNPSTVIRFSLPEAAMVTLRVYDMSGRLVATLADRHFEAGTHDAAFDGSSLASGMYYYTIRAADRVETRSMLLVK